MKYIGFVNNIRRKSTKQVVTVVLNYEELKSEKLVLGEFLVIASGGTRKFLARVEDCYYAPIKISSDAMNDALATGRLNNHLDESSVKYINFLHYDLALLGEMPLAEGRFFAGIREVPSLMDVQIYRPDQSELQKIVDAEVPGTTGQVTKFELGSLQYGTREKSDGTPALPPFTVKISFNVKNLHPKRTAVFGKTGYGKSNLIKTLISLTHHYNPGTAQLIFDVNGEYGFSNKQGAGLIDVFKNAGNKADIVVYSNRKDAQVQYGEETVKPIKFDVIENPEMAVALVVGKRRQRDRGEADYLDALQDPDMHATVRSFWRCFCVQELGLKPSPNHKANYEASDKYKTEKKIDKATVHIIDDFEEAHEAILKYSTSSTAKSLSGKSGQFAFLTRLHYLGAAIDNNIKADMQPSINFLSALKSDISKGKVVILDLPSLASNLLAPLSDKIANELFSHAQENFLVSSVADDSKSYTSTPVLMYVEEAHNVLSDSQNTVFPRIAREGRKYGIGLVYSTQRPGSIDEDILTQTENFFVMHVGSEEDATQLKKAKVAFDAPISDFILTEPAVGVAYVYSEPYQPYVLSCKVRKFEDVLADDNSKDSKQSSN